MAQRCSGSRRESGRVAGAPRCSRTACDRLLLTDLRERSGLLRDRGLARLVECADAETARSLARDRTLRSLCMLTGDRHLAFSAEDEAAVRKRLRTLGFVLPPRE